jgi:hypothetical protein
VTEEGEIVRLARVAVVERPGDVLIIRCVGRRGRIRPPHARAFAVLSIDDRATVGSGELSRERRLVVEVARDDAKGGGHLDVHPYISNVDFVNLDVHAHIEDEIDICAAKCVEAQTYPLILLPGKNVDVLEYCANVPLYQFDPNSCKTKKFQHHSQLDKIHVHRSGGLKREF